MLSSWDKLDDDNKKKFIKIIEEQSNRLIHLVENMLAVTKIKSGSVVVYNEVDIKPVIEQTVTIVKNQYPSQNFELTIKNNLPKIFADKDKFQQIMTNLIENSAKYSPDSTTTKISATAIMDNVEIKVSNIGIGINKDDYEKIFTKFSRIDNPLTRKVQGSGLGLFITKNLTEKMGGSIYVESVPLGDNSGMSNITFVLHMPVKSIEEQAKIKCNR